MKTHKGEVADGHLACVFLRIDIMKKLSSLLLAGLLPLLSLNALAAQNDLDAVRTAGEIRIGTEGTYAPFSYHDASNKLVGFDVDTGRAIADKLGVKADFVEGKRSDERRGGKECGSRGR